MKMMVLLVLVVTAVVESFLLNPVVREASFLLTRRRAFGGKASGDEERFADPNSEVDSLALSFRSDNGTRDEEFVISGTKKESTSLAPRGEGNAYYDIVAGLGPKELIGRFAKSAPPRVQEAVRSTILGLLGSAGAFATETMTVTTSEKLANLMFQLQMTGYMFKNADYRISLSQSLDDANLLPSGDKSLVPVIKEGPLPEVRGTVSMNVAGTDVKIEADAYMKELREEVQQLRADLARIDQDKRLSSSKDLLAFIRSMPEQQLQGLTEGVTEDVLDAMKKLVYSIMRGLPGADNDVTSDILGALISGNNENKNNNALTDKPGALVQQSGSAMAQLCMWQLVIGYNLRELEVRTQLKQQFGKSK